MPADNQTRVETSGGEGSRQPASRAAWITLAILGAGAAYLSFLMLRPFLGALLVGAVMALVSSPVQERIRKRVGRPSMASLLTTMIVLIVFLAPLALVITVVVRELRQAYEALGPGAGGQGASRLWDAAAPLLAKIAAWSGTTVEQLRTAAEARVQEAGSTLLRRALSLAGAATGGVLNVAIAVAALYLALRRGDQLHALTMEWSPLGETPTRQLLDAARQVIVASVNGVLAVAVAQGTLCGLGVWITGLPLPALWGFAAAVASVVPVFGSTLVWLPAALTLFLQGSVGKGVFMLAWGAGIVGTIDNVIRPLVVRTALPMNPLVIFIAILGGVQAFGAIGILAGPVTLAVTLALFRIVREELRDAHEPE
jgi:predicted PurR-regulated permease PerM